VMDKNLADASEAYRKASEDQADARRHIRVSVKLAAVYGMNNEPSLALAVYVGLASAYPKNEYVTELLRKAQTETGKP